jgi:hypothetical protein
VHQSYSLAGGLQWSAQWTAGGAVLFAGSFVLSVLLGAPESAIAASMAALFGYAVLINVPPLRRFSSLNVFTVMAATHAAPLTLCAAIVVAMMLVWVAAYLTERRDF